MKESEQQNTFDAWMRNHKGLLFKVVRAYAYTAEDQDDLFQEIALQVWHSIPHYRGDAAVTTWLYKIAFYAALAWVRKEKKHRTGKQSIDGVEHILTVRTSAKDSRLQWLYEQIADLSPVDRSLMLLLLDGFSYKEMAAILGISESNVGVKINRIKGRLASKPTEEANHGL
jgi:RNA polymerase sigma-70 factor (ECF subfamily)